MSGDYLGAIDVVAFALPPEGATAGWRGIAESMRAGHIALLDVDFVEKTEDSFRHLTPEEVSHLGGDEIGGASSEILDDGDILLAISELSEGEKAVVLLKEVLSFIPVVAAFEAEGARLIAEAPVYGEDLEALLEEEQS